MTSHFSKLHRLLTEDGVCDSSSEISLSPSSCSTSSVPSPHPAFVNPISIPSKSLLSPPSTNSSNYSPSPSTLISPVCCPSAICAFPSWPNRDYLSPPLSSLAPSYSGSKTSGAASSFISDEDLLDLAELELYNGSRVPVGMLPDGWNALNNEISWEATRQPPVVVASPPQKASCAKGRRRSSPLKQKRPAKKLSTIKEGRE